MKEKKSLPPAQQPLDSARSNRLGLTFGYGLVILCGLAATSCSIYHQYRDMLGLHDWARANAAWAVRSQANYGWAFTKGYKTLALGNPPGEPVRYVSHPVLPTLADSVPMKIFGDRLYKLPTWIANFAGLLLLTALLRRVLSDARGLVAGILLALFPITCYFGDMEWSLMIEVWVFWRYLQLLGRLPGSVRPRFAAELALGLFLLIQLSWQGVFTCAVLAGHYLLLVLFKKEKYRGMILCAVFLSPLLSTLLNVLVMLSGYEWDWDRIISLYRWRSAAGERGTFEWGAWLAVFWRYSVTNYTLPVLLTGLAYCLWRVITSVFNKWYPRVSFAARKTALSFDYWWWFLLPGLLFLLVFKGLVWEHQYWLEPLTVFVAIAASSGLVACYRLSRHWLGRMPTWLLSGIAAAALTGSCAYGTYDYFAVRWQSPRTIELFKQLHHEIPADKALLSFKDLRPWQNENKPRFLRPEYAWHLDRQVEVADALDEVEAAAVSGRCPIYFIPDADQPGGPGARGAFLRQKTNEVLLELLEAARRENNRAYQEAIVWELQQRYRLQLIEQLKKRYRYRYIDNPRRNDARGNTPCYLFYLTQTD